MADRDRPVSGFVQVGQTAMRDPTTGEMLQSVPLFIRGEDCGKVPRAVMENVGAVLAEKMKAYVNGCRQLKKEGNHD